MFRVLSVHVAVCTCGTGGMGLVKGKNRIVEYRDIGILGGLESSWVIVGVRLGSDESWIGGS